MKKVFLLLAFGLFMAGTGFAQTTEDSKKDTETVVQQDAAKDTKSCDSSAKKSCCKKGKKSEAQAKATADKGKGCCSSAKKSSCKGKAQAAKKEDEPAKKEKEDADVG